MAKDGSRRGGKRPGAGRKPKPLAEKLQEGKKAEALSLPDIPDIEGEEMPDVKEFLSSDQRQGELKGDVVYETMWKWLKRNGCAHLVSPHLVQMYSMALARWIQLENISSELGFLSKHPTTGAAITSPFISIAQGYLKEANVIYQQIFSIVAENCREPVTGNPADDLMEKLLGV